jgi:predicted PurR-regulated permease PerM
MNIDADFRRRLAFGLVVAALLVVVAYVVRVFVAVAVFSVFLYYAVRPIFRFLDRFDLGRKTRATLSILLFGLPFVILIGYAVAVVALEVQSFLDGETADRVANELNIGNLDLNELEQLLTSDANQLNPDLVVDTVLDATSIAGSVFVQLLLIVTITYYMLADGPRLMDWLFETYDETGILREYATETDSELSMALFGNIVNVFVAAIITIVTYYGFNLFVPDIIDIPFPALLGAIAGIGSLIPVVGIKLVYIPLTIGLGGRAWLAGEPELLAPIAVLFVVSAFFGDFVPDIIIRAQVSSDDTHSGLLVIAYVVGPSVFGFYGLFLAPIVLICMTNAVTVLLPYVLSGSAAEPGQTTLDEFEEGTESETE